ncbi:MAG TPA: PilZ domain-containing protein [Desulfobacterales bacterium]|nr:PilZ domain-containing protein [Desulfobacterales bacterium]
MFASFLSQKRVSPQDPEDVRVHSYSALVRMFTLIAALPEERQWQVFRQLHNEKLPNALFKLIVDMPLTQRLLLMEQLEQSAKNGGPSSAERRRHPRKDCLVMAEVEANGRSSRSYLLDISPQGAFIESLQQLAEGEPVTLSFRLPNSRSPVRVDAHVVWSNGQAAGVVFKGISRPHREALRAFAEEKETVYEIIS